MSAIQELAPYISAYQRNIKRAKEDQHYTIDRLVEESGVSRSAVTKLCAGTQQDPKLYNSAALCRVLGLSLDELFGLTKCSGRRSKPHTLSATCWSFSVPCLRFR